MPSIFSPQAFYTHQLINHQNTHVNISFLIITLKNDELLLLTTSYKLHLKYVYFVYETFPQYYALHIEVV